MAVTLNVVCTRCGKRLQFTFASEDCIIGERRCACGARFSFSTEEPRSDIPEPWDIDNEEDCEVAYQGENASWPVRSF